MFYGSAKEKIAIEEIIDKKGGKKDLITVALFKNQKPLNLIDLTNIPDISMFDLERSKIYEPAIFLRSFAKEASQKILKDGQEHIDYVPTQVVTEYFRHVLPSKIDKPIDGIIYESAVKSGEICYVIFATNEECSDVHNIKESTVLSTELINFKVKKVVDLI